MTRNVYDFDGTIYRGDSSTHFFLFCLLHNPLAALPALGAIPIVIRMLCKRANKTEAKERVHRYLTRVKDVERMVGVFWRTHEKNLMPWYLAQRTADDLIISASPEFLLEPICKKLGVALIASRVDPHTGRYDGLNCHDEEKVRRMRALYPDDTIDLFYSDSHADTPLAKLARESFRVLPNGDRRPFFEA